MKKLWQLSEALIVIIGVSTLFCVWIANDFLCIIDDSRYKQ